MERDPTARPGGFTLIELLIAVTLVAMLIVATSYIFDTSIRAVNITQANDETTLNTATFVERMRADLEGLENDGFLVMGARQQEAYGTSTDRVRGEGMKRTFRNDWVQFMVNCENRGGFDSRVAGQIMRVRYTQGRVAKPSYTHHSDVGADWVLMRNGVIVIPVRAVDEYSIAVIGGLDLTWSQRIGFEMAGGIGYGMDKSCQYLVQMYTEDISWDNDPVYTYPLFGSTSSRMKEARFQWYRQRGSNCSLIAAQTDYLDNTSDRPSSNGEGFLVLPHCAEFRVEYAMAADLLADGSVDWQDPPMYDPDAADPATTGWKEFAPGDEWPVLLRVTATVYDTLSRVQDPRKVELIVPVPNNRRG